MAYKPIKMHLVRTIIQLLRRKTPERTIAAEVGISKNTVSKYKQKIKGKQLEELLQLDDQQLNAIIYNQPDTTKSTDPRRAAFDAKCDYYLKELKRRGVTKQLLWEEYRKEYPDGYGRTQFNELLAQHKKNTQLSMIQSYIPAEIIMIDFAGDRFYYTDKDSRKRIPLDVLVCVLPFSGYCFVIALPNATQTWLIKALNSALDFFGGAPLSLLCDNMRQAVKKSCKYEPAFTDTFSAWALHNNIHLQAARVRKPTDKPHVENQVKLTYQNIYAPLRDKTFHSIEEVNEAFKKQLHLFNNKPFQIKEHSRTIQFKQQEQPLLQPLPKEHYAIKHQTTATVQRDYHAMLYQDKHKYSVPFKLVSKKVTLVYDTDTVEIYDGLTRVATHKRSYKSYDHTTTKEHMPEAHQQYKKQLGYNRNYFLSSAAIIGPDVKRYIERVLQSKPIEQQSYDRCIGILRLTKKYPPNRINNACTLALSTSADTYKIIETILINKADLSVQPTPPTPMNYQLPTHENIRGAKAYC